MCVLPLIFPKSPFHGGERETRFHVCRYSLNLTLKFAGFYFQWTEGHASFLPHTGLTMKLKELERPAVQAWSPASQYPVYLATGTSAQQLDASFSTNGTLEIFEVDFRDPSLDLKHKGVLSASSRFYKLIWGSFGSGLPEGSGIIAGGGDNGLLTLYNVTHILSSGKEPVIAQRQKHTGPVRALDFNPFQANLLASGASDSEIFIWDLNNLNVPMTPGSKSQQPPEDIKALAWNRQVQHILSSAHPSGKVAVWDLRKNEPIIKVSDHSNRMHSSGLAWHPDIATQLVLCSEDDRFPVIQLWDLRFASSPLKVLESHSRGILSMSWSQADAELLLSSAKDNQILCWNLGSSEVPEQVAQASLIPPLKKPPKWMRRPAGVSFAFGGKLVTFGLPSTPAHQVPQPCLRLVFVSQVIIESEFLRRSAELWEALESGNLLNYCQDKIEQTSLQSEKMLWQFLKVTLEEDSRMKFLKLLGYSKDELQKKVATCLKSDVGLGESPQSKGDDLHSNRQQVFCSQTSKHLTEEASASSSFFDELVPQNMTPLEIPITEDTDGLLSQALLLGALRPAVELCLKEERFADAIILAQAGGADLLRRTQECYWAKKKTRISSLIACVVRKNWEDMVHTCNLQNWKEALALLLTYSGPEKFPELCDMLGTRMEQEGGGALISEARLCYVCSGSVELLVECWAKCHQASYPLALQDLMEKVMVLNRSLELLRDPDRVSSGPATTFRVTQYASLLAAQGSLATAMSYLPRDCTQAPVQQLRDRLFHAQGSGVLGQQCPPFPFARVVVGATPHSKETSSYRLGFQPSHQVPTPSPRPRIFTPQSSLVTPLISSHPGPYQSSQTQNISAYRAPELQAAQPLPLAPSVRPAFFEPPLLSGQKAQISNPLGFPGAWPLPGPPPPVVSSDAIQPSSTSLAETTRLFPPLPVRLPGVSPASFGSLAPPVNFSTTHPPGGPGAACSSALPITGPSTAHPGPQDSLKNAPMPRANLQRKKLSEIFMPPAPITAPVMSLTPEPRGVLSSQPSVLGMGHAPPGAPGEFSLQQLQQRPPEKVERKELPPEHQSLKTSFEKLLQRCSLSATDLKTKRKLEKAAQRLECLYDKLCQGTLSPHVLAGLHEVAQCVDAGDFEQGLAVHAQVVACSSFSEVSSFMLVLKAVLTIAQKLHM
ncbi:protein transport protein Sec31B isoform X8 [Mustela putorius furo]|uniref:Protein transport protein Sec31B n=1 Tax=Mustela putorius furo TaxID=9669 RepID=A0A8U0NRP1_MUSPF|nr:protein transport protein Sec31B isoform X8 [Mustela putorius furo]